MIRETGYYWVKMPEFTWAEDHAPDWEVCYFFEEKWYSTSYATVDFADEHFYEINETRILNPDEK